MTTFDELIGAEPTGADRDRLRSVHELLVEAGAPPELTPELEAGPSLAMTLGRVRALATSRRRFYLPAMAAAVVLAMVIGLSFGGNGKSLVAIPLKGTAAEPQATGTLSVLAPTKNTQPMLINVRGLDPGTYGVYLVHAGSYEKCGTFLVTSSEGGPAKTIQSPYRAKAGDRWVVTRETATGRGETVMIPIRA